MFEVTYANLMEQIDAALQSAKLGDKLRNYVSKNPTLRNGHSFVEKLVYEESPTLLSWKLFDYCAVVLRLYSAYEIFVTAFVRDVCSEFPNCVGPFSALPKRLRQSHRAGFGKIVLEIEEKRYHSKLDEKIIIPIYLNGINDELPYALVSEAFLVNKNALRLDRLLGLLADIGFENIESSLLSNKMMQTHLGLAGAAGERKDTLRRKLDGFIDSRNEAAHTEITETGSVEQLREYGYLLRDLCMALVEIGEQAFIQRYLDAGKLLRSGTVTEVYKGNHVAVAACAAGTFKVGDEVILERKGKALTGSIVGIMVNDQDTRGISVIGELELGLELTSKVKIGDSIFLSPPTVQPLEPPASEDQSEPGLAEDEDEVVEGEDAIDY